MKWNNKLFTSLNVINRKSSPYVHKDILIHYDYQSDPILCPGIVAIKIIPCSCHAYLTILPLTGILQLKKHIII